MCLSIINNKLYNKMCRYIMCDLHTSIDKRLFCCETFESLGKVYMQIIRKKAIGVRKNMIFKFVDLHAQRSGKRLNYKKDKYVYLCKDIIGIEHLPKDTYEIVLEKYNELFKIKYESFIKDLEIAYKKIEQKQKSIAADVSKLKSKHVRISEDISVSEERLLQFYRENNRLRTKKEILVKIESDLTLKIKTYCDIENNKEVVKKNRSIAIQYSSGMFEIEHISDIFLPYEVYLDACESYLIHYDKQSTNIKTYPFFELIRKQSLQSSRIDKAGGEAKIKQEFEELELYRNNLYIAIQENKNTEKVTEFIVQKNIFDEVNKYIDSLICLRQRKNILKELLNLYNSKKYDVFINLCPIQIEGIFNDLQYDVELLERFDTLSLDPTQDLKHKINSIEDSIPYEYVLYFGHFFNNLQRNIVAHGRWLLEHNTVEVANELLLDLHTLLYMVSRCSQLERMYRFTNNYVHNNSINQENCYAALYYDLTGERIHGDYDYIGHIKPKQVLLWIFNPFYENCYKRMADENDNSLEELRNIISSADLWDYIDKNIDKKICSGVGNNYLKSFKYTLVELSMCNISKEAKSKINEIKTKLFKLENNPVV